MFVLARGPDAAADAATDTPSDTAADAAQDAPVMPTGTPRMWDVRATGPFRVGYRLRSLTYTPRGASAPRTIPVHIWYPTLATDGPRVPYALIFRDRETILDAPLAPSAYGAQYPVHLYSHGDRGNGPNSHFLLRYFASHGWVALAPDHVGNTLGDTPPVRPFAIYHLRAQDLRAVLDLAADLPADDPLRGRLDTRKVVLSGHSFGSHSVWSVAGATFDEALTRTRCTPENACTEADLAVVRAGLGDPRVVAAIPMAGSLDRNLFGPDGHRSVRIPLLSMSGSADPVGAEGQFTSSAPVDLTWIDVRGGCHQFFALGGCDEIPDALQNPIVGTWALAFARRHVLDDDTPAVLQILDGTTPLSDRITLRRR